ncbi:MAG: bacillithiol system redox-active protein YtxJ [Cytophagaceae bacterium]|nr:bacillithiol system redox-active protein YtxJ [Cytophagaceae bacterium]
MNWNILNEITRLDEISEESKTQPVAIFKHSIRCPISSTAKDRVERAWSKVTDHKNLKVYYLDLINLRQISNHVATKFGVQHESPQIIVLKNGEVIYDESHYGINLEEILEKI